MGLYAQLLRELEAEVGELELENRHLCSHICSLEEESDLLSSGGGCAGPLATAATTTRTLLASGTGCIGVSDSNVQFLKGLVGLLESAAAMQMLAWSSATGQRIACNTTTMEQPLRLPVAVVNTIKEHVTKMCGHGCNFNAVINSKCGTSRRAVKKMVVKMK